ncbi:MAG: glutamate--tRNA ligase [Patescibacteria group bacterium]|nr:glutamate--tRNA ligase [Patescibacteria group bacterium]
MNKTRTRFAPSPTGMLHIGQVLTALYAYLVAKQNKGSFIFRLEDTDRERLVPGSAENIADTLKWLGLEWDEGVKKGGQYGPYIQSERLEVYKKYAQDLVEKGLAYKNEGAIWFKTEKEGKTSWVDVVGNKKIEIDNNLQADFVMIKSDGYPTYNFAVVIDDHLMEVTHVIRGVEFISSTPKHIMLYKAFEWELPLFVHLPLILGPDRSKLSKRHGAKPAWDFKQDGFLPEAILNYMALLGWTPPEGKELMSLDEMVKSFDLKKIHVSNPIFDITKLEWMNGEYIRKTQNSKLKTQIFQYTRDLSGGALTPEDHPTEEEIEKLVPLVKERIKKLSDFIPLTDFLWEKPEYDMEVFKKIKVADQKMVLEKIATTLESLPRPWNTQTFEQAFRKLAEGLDIKAGDLFQLIRVAISGQLVTPPLFESMEILGEEESLDRIRKVTQKYSDLGTL